MKRIEGYCQKLSEYYNETGNKRVAEDAVEFPPDYRKGTEGKCLTNWCPLAQGGLGLCNMKAKYIGFELFQPKDQFNLPVQPQATSLRS